MQRLRLSRRPRSAVAAVNVAVALVATGAWTVNAYAAGRCSVQYAVASQWAGGFTGAITVTNLGDRLDGWTLTWSYPTGQQISQGWNATVTQSGTRVNATGVTWNSAIDTGGSASFGFNASWTGTNPAPVSFALNGATCAGVVRPAPTSGQPTSTPFTPTPTTTPPTTTPPSSPPVTGTPTTPPASYPNPASVSGDTGAHDPTVVKNPNGGYILAVTGPNLVLKTSTNRTAWRGAGTVWPNGAPWTTSYTNGSTSLWAPDISYHNGQYYLYYAASSFGSQHSAIFLATSPTGASGSWTNQGLIIDSSKAVTYNAIDPNLIIDGDGQWWLAFGSFWSGIKLIRLDPATGKRSTVDTTVRSLATRTTNGGAIEAPFVFRHGSYYYLWLSFDLCCKGAASTYRIMVGRSTSITGPYTDRNGMATTSGGGTQVLAGHGAIHGPGHQAVISETDGDVLFYHYYANNGASFLGINRIGYDSAGWPFVY